MALACPSSSASAQTPSEQATANYMESIKDNEPHLYMFLRSMPKGGDLHNHLSGAIYAESFIAWAASAGMCADTSWNALVRGPCVLPSTAAWVDSAKWTKVPAARALTDAALRNRLIDAMSMRNWNPARPNSGHDDFFDTFGKFGAVSFSNDAAMLAEAAHRAAANNLVYLELMQTPEGGSGSLARTLGWNDDFETMRQRLLDAGLRDTLEAANEAYDSIFAEQRRILNCDAQSTDRGPTTSLGTGSAATPADPGCDIEIRLLYQVLRARAPEMVFAQILAGFEMASTYPRFVGLNLVQPEDDPVAMRDYSLHMRMISHLRQFYPQVPVTLHAGELTLGLVPPEGLRFHIREAVRVAGAKRIGHGVDIAYEDSAQSLLEQMAREKVMVEIALSSNDGILGVAGEEHPLQLYKRFGVPMALVTDDEGVSRGEITWEFVRAVREQGVGYLELKEMVFNSLDYSFLDAQTKRGLRGILEDRFRQFENVDPKPVRLHRQPN